MTARWAWAGVALLCAVGLWQLPTGDVVRAQALHDHALDVAADDPSDPIWVDVHREWVAIMPWQAGYSEAREAASGIEERRRGLLRDAVQN